MTLRHRWQHVAALALLLITFLVPVSAASAQTTDKQDPFGVGLGGSQQTFEAQYDAPTSTKGASDFAKGDQYAVSGYKSVLVYWHGGYSAHIVLNAKSGWTSQKAVDIANRWLPSDFKQSGKASDLSDGSVLAQGHSAALAKRFSAGTYAKYKVGGKQGDLRVVFIPAGSGDTVGSIDIAIGTGKELGATATNASTPAANNPNQGSTTNQGSASEATYLKTVRKNVDALTKSMDDFNTIIAKGSSMTDAEYQQLITILTGWITAPADAKALKAPAAYTDLQQAYEAAANDLSGASIDLTNYLSNGGQDQTLLTSAKDKLSSAKSELQQADQLLTAAGA